MAGLRFRMTARSWAWESITGQTTILPVWSGVPLTMLLILLAIISSTALLVGAVSAMGGEHAWFQGTVAISLSLALAAANFFIVQRAGLRLAKITSAKPEAVQSLYGKAFCLVVLLWAVCAEFIGFWTVRLVRSFL